jgi:hypothetical protein
VGCGAVHAFGGCDKGKWGGENRKMKKGKGKNENGNNRGVQSNMS